MTSPDRIPQVSRSALAEVQRTNADRIAREMQNALDHLKNVVRAATREIDHLEHGMTSGTDFVSQYAEKYALALAKLEALGEADRSLTWLAAQEPSA